MKYYKLFNTYAEYLDYIKVQTPSIVDFGTTMINKRKCKHKKK